MPPRAKVESASDVTLAVAVAVARLEERFEGLDRRQGELGAVIQRQLADNSTAIKEIAVTIESLKAARRRSDGALGFAKWLGPTILAIAAVLLNYLRPH